DFQAMFFDVVQVSGSRLSSATPAAAPPRNAGQFASIFESAGSIKAVAIMKNCLMHEPFQERPREWRLAVPLAILSDAITVTPLARRWKQRDGLDSLVLNFKADPEIVVAVGFEVACRSCRCLRGL